MGKTSVSSSEAPLLLHQTYMIQIHTYYNLNFFFFFFGLLRDAKESKTLFDSILSNSVGENEGDVEKKLRQTGEWLIDKTENTSASAGN